MVHDRARRAMGKEAPIGPRLGVDRAAGSQRRNFVNVWDLAAGALLTGYGLLK